MNKDYTEWLATVHDSGNSLIAGFWDCFVKTSDRDLDSLEVKLNRSLPSDYRAFLIHIGYGDFPEPFGGYVYSPQEVFEGALGPLLMMSAEASKVNKDTLFDAYIYRQPNVIENTIGVPMPLDLFDLVQIGSDGRCCYHQLVCSTTRESEIGFLTITPETTFEDVCGSFAQGMAAILTHFEELKVDSLPEDRLRYGI